MLLHHPYDFPRGIPVSIEGISARYSRSNKRVFDTLSVRACQRIPSGFDQFHPFGFMPHGYAWFTVKIRLLLTLRSLLQSALRVSPASPSPGNQPVQLCAHLPAREARRPRCVREPGDGGAAARVFAPLQAHPESLLIVRDHLCFSTMDRGKHEGIGTQIERIEPNRLTGTLPLKKGGIVHQLHPPPSICDRSQYLPERDLLRPSQSE